VVSLEDKEKEMNYETSLFVPSLVDKVDDSLFYRLISKNYYYLIYKENFIREIKGFYPFTIFEKYIVDLKNNGTYLFDNLASLYSDINCFNYYKGLDSIFFKNKYKECFQKLNDVMKEKILKVKELFLKPISIGFLTYNNKTVTLKTFPNAFHPESSISHIDYINYFKSNDSMYFDTKNITKYCNQDMLMYYRISNVSNSTILSTVAKNNKYGLISSNILDILKTIGWTEKGGKKSNLTYYVDESIKYIDDDNLEESSYNKTLLNYKILIITVILYFFIIIKKKKKKKKKKKQYKFSINILFNF